ncbi:hypothetical protein [Nocardia vermiculata]|uniref:Large secreted protein n=1 Tax=Nocardia vermiculata TaxID=257274 RepID=A0A846XT82_9NOCA|nr:hypothetical protein [Nocardia vermiculata]NKY48715.1 hypothetical protein [Nocardia vermiculata]
MDWIPARRRVTAAAVAFLALPALLVTACGNSDDDAAQTTASSTPSVSPPTEQNPPEPGRLFTADPTITNTHPLHFDSWSRVADDRIAVNFQTGSPECYGVDATATETDTTVTVDLKSGTLPSAVGRMCTMIAVFGTLEIPLKQPLGDREVLSAN